MLRRRSAEEREKGQMLVLFSLVLVVILAFAALAIDLGVLRNNRQILRNTTDAAALAGGTLMPVDGSVAGAASAVATLINSTIQTNYPGLPRSATAIGSRCVVGVDPNIAACAYTISYRCLIGADSSGPFVSRSVPVVCDPRHSLLGLVPNPPGTLPPPLSPTDLTELPSHFTGAGDTRISSCNPSVGDLCNVVDVAGSSTTQYAFAPVVGIVNGNSGAVSSAACGGVCGALPILNDVELLIDKSGSMQTNSSNGYTRIYWAQLAANNLVTNLEKNGGIGATGNEVGITTFSGTTASSLNTWASTAAQLKTTINAITASGNTPTATGMKAATADLNGPPGPYKTGDPGARNDVGGAVKRVVIFLSDGRPNPDQGPNGLPANDASGQRPTADDIKADLGSADIAYSILVAPSPTSYYIGQMPYLSPEISDPDWMKSLATKDNPTEIGRAHV